MLKGIRLYLDTLNEQGGIGGKRVELLVFDDHDDSEAAKAEARKALESQAIAVLGHASSAATISAGEIYREGRLPAMTASATAQKATTNNDWYFRLAITDTLQAQMLATYIAKILKQSTVSIVADTDNYGTSLARDFEKFCRKLDISIQNRWQLDSNQKDGNGQLYAIAEAIKKWSEPGILFVALHAPEGAQLVSFLRVSQCVHTIVGPQTFSTNRFVEHFSQKPMERFSPGHYTDGIYTINPFYFEIGDQQTQQFYKAFQAKYGEQPSWIAAAYYDAAKLLAEALNQTESEGLATTLTSDRRKIRDYLEHRFRPGQPFDGVMGETHFTSLGNVLRLIPVSVYKQGQLVTTLAQLQFVPAREIPQNRAMIKKLLEDEQLINSGGQDMYRTDSVYTGIAIQTIKDIDLNSGTCVLDFYLWFRYQHEFDPTAITFLNALEPIRFSETFSDIPKMQRAVLIDSKMRSGQVVKMYRVKGTFMLDFLPEARQFGTLVIGFSFQHKSLSQKNLVYLADLQEMSPANGTNLTQYWQQAHILSPASGWRIDEALFFQKAASSGTLGDLRIFRENNAFTQNSRFHAVLRLKPVTLDIRSVISMQRNLLPDPFLQSLLLGSGTLLGLLWGWRKIQQRVRLLRMEWVIQTVCLLLLLNFGQIAVVNYVGEQCTSQYMDLILRILETLWWILPAFLAVSALEPFIWAPLELRTARKIPKLVRNVTAIAIYFLTGAGVLAFVFHQKLTGLLATSGILAMIIGLAIQMNLSNIFSGLALSIELPFRVDDWVKIGDQEGKVIDVTWRSTRLQTRFREIVSLPNSTVANSRIQNFHYPDEVFYDGFYVYLDPIHDPKRIEGLLNDAVLAVKEVRQVWVIYMGCNEWSAQYWVTYEVADYGEKWIFTSFVWKRIWNNLHYAGIQVACKERKFHGYHQHILNEQDALSALAMLQKLPIFSDIPDELKLLLSQRMRRLQFASGETILRQSEPGESMFIIVDGVVGVWTNLEDGSRHQVNRLGIGDFFGENAILMGEVRNATIVAQTEVCLYELHKNDLSPLLVQFPELAHILDQTLSRRTIQTANEHVQAQRRAKNSNLSSPFLQKIKRLFLKRSI